jgi:hypothetical protein
MSSDEVALMCVFGSVNLLGLEKENHSFCSTLALPIFWK